MLDDNNTSKEQDKGVANEAAPETNPSSNQSQSCVPSCGELDDEGNAAVRDGAISLTITSGVGASTPRTITAHSATGSRGAAAANITTNNNNNRSQSAGEQVLGSVTGTNNWQVQLSGQRASPRRSQTNHSSNDDVKLYRYKFHLVSNPSENIPNNTPNSSESPSSEPCGTPQSGVNIAEPPPACISNSASSTMIPSLACFNKYPAPVFTKTVMSARANRIKRGLAEGAARRTRVNNDLRDELTRIIQLTSEQRYNQILRQQQLTLLGHSVNTNARDNHVSRKTPLLSANKQQPAISRDNTISKCPDGPVRADSSPEVTGVSLGPDGRPDYPPTEIWPSSRVCHPPDSHRSASHPRISHVEPANSDDSVLTPPNSAAATAGSFGYQFGFPEIARARARPSTPAASAGRLMRGATTPRSSRLSQAATAQNGTPGIGDNEPMNFAMKLLETDSAGTNKNEQTDFNNRTAFAIRHRKSHSHSRSFEVQ